MKRAFLMAVVLAAGSCSTAWAADNNWMFKRSYYSHQPIQPVEIGKRNVGGPYYTRPQGAYTRAGYRWNRSNIIVGNQAFDHVNVFESWFQTGGQF